MPNASTSIDMAATGLLSSVLRCPKCAGPLSAPSGGLLSSFCGWNRAPEAGIWKIERDSSYYFGDDRASIRALLDTAESGGVSFPAIMSSDLLSRGDLGSDYATGWNRADILQWLDLDNKTVVDFGCGWGTYAIPAAFRADGVVAVDRTFERLRLLSMRVRNEKLTNVAIVHGDVQKLRWMVHSFDVALVIGLLEWLPTGLATNPRSVQVGFLKRIFDGMKSGGSLLLGIENRLNPFYFLGHTDHGELPFAPLLPRPLADILTRCLKHHRFTHFLYTRVGYRRLLKEAGFTGVRFVYPIPSYKQTVFLASSLAPETVGKYLREHYVQSSLRLGRRLEWRALKAAMRLRAAEVFLPTYYILGLKK